MNPARWMMSTGYSVALAILVVANLAAIPAAASSKSERVAKVDRCYEAVEQWGKQADETFDSRTNEDTVGQVLDQGFDLIGKRLRGLSYIMHYYFSSLRFLAENADRGADTIDFVVERCFDYMVPHLTRCQNPLECTLELD